MKKKGFDIKHHASKCVESSMRKNILIIRLNKQIMSRYLISEGVVESLMSSKESF